MMGEQNHLAPARAVDECGEPGHLRRVQVMIDEGRIEPHQQPLRVLERHAAVRLAEKRQRAREVRRAARVHLMVAVESYFVAGARGGPHSHEPLVYLALGAGVIDVAQMHHHLKACRVIRNRIARYGRAVEAGSPVAEQSHTKRFADRAGAASRVGSIEFLGPEEPQQTDRQPANHIQVVELDLFHLPWQRGRGGGIFRQRSLHQKALQPAGQRVLRRRHHAGSLILFVERAQRFVERGQQLRLLHRIARQLLGSGID